MSKIIIDIQGLISHEDAIKAVTEVIKGGMVSVTAKRKTPHYCWKTVFGDRIVVATKRKDYPGAADSFTVYEK